MNISYEALALTPGLTLALEASIIALGLTWIVLLILRRFPILDMPEPGRSSHKKPTPTSGGLSFIVGLLGAQIYLYTQGIPLIESFNGIILGSACLLSVVGFMDEFKEIPFTKRLLAQFIVSALLVFLSPIESMFQMALLVILLAGFINATNFCDGLNGLLGTGMMIATAFLSFYIPDLLPSLLPLSAGLLMFLIYNWRGKIFMGDVGSFFLGLYVPALLLTTPHLLFNILVLGHLLFIYILDVSVTIARRIIQKQSVVKPHRDFHFHHLRDMGLPHLAVTSIYGFFSLLQGLTLNLMRLETLGDFVYLYVFDFALYGSLLMVIYNTSKTYHKVTGNAPKA